MSFDASEVVFFFGAGASAPFGIPTMKQFVVDFEEFLNENGSDNEINRYSHIKEKLEDILKRKVDLEAIFTVIDGIINYNLERLGMLSLYSATALNIPNKTDVEICRKLKKRFQLFIREKCWIPKESFDKISEVYLDFFNRLAKESEVGGSDFSSRGRYEYCNTWTMFTTNYDTCLEHYWRHVVRANLNTGSKAQETTRTWVLNPNNFSKEGLRLLKLHGSISWLIEPDGTVTEEQTIGRPLVGREFVGEMMIYPVQEKELYVEPYVSMLRELNHELKRRPIWIIIGYSFNDPVIREIFIRNSSKRKKIVLLHPKAQKIRREKLMNIKCREMPLLNQNFGEDDFRSVKYSVYCGGLITPGTVAVKVALAKYEERIKNPPIGKKFQECYDLATLTPSKEYLELYRKTKKELWDMGLKFEY